MPKATIDMLRAIRNGTQLKIKRGIDGWNEADRSAVKNALARVILAKDGGPSVLRHELPGIIREYFEPVVRQQDAGEIGEAAAESGGAQAPEESA